MKFHGLEEPSVVEEGTKGTQLDFEGQSRAPENSCLSGLEGELFAGVEH